MKVLKFLIVIFVTIIVLSLNNESKAQDIDVPIYKSSNLETNGITKKYKLKNLNDLASYSILDEQQNLVSLSTFKGCPILLHFWATWCPPCLEEMPSLQKFFDEYSSRGLKVMAISIDKTGFEKISPFFEKHDLNSLPQYWDSFGNMPAKARFYGGLPVSFLVNKAGTPVARIDGAVNWQDKQVMRFIKDILLLDKLSTGSKSKNCI